MVCVRGQAAALGGRKGRGERARRRCGEAGQSHSSRLALPLARGQKWGGGSQCRRPRALRSPLGQASMRGCWPAARRPSGPAHRQLASTVCARRCAWCRKQAGACLAAWRARTHTPGRWLQAVHTSQVGGKHARVRGRRARGAGPPPTAGCQRRKRGQQHRSLLLARRTCMGAHYLLSCCALTMLYPHKMQRCGHANARPPREAAPTACGACCPCGCALSND